MSYGGSSNPRTGLSVEELKHMTAMRMAQGQDPTRSIPGQSRQSRHTRKSPSPQPSTLPRHGHSVNPPPPTQYVPHKHYEKPSKAHQYALPSSTRQAVPPAKHHHGPALSMSQAVPRAARGHSPILDSSESSSSSTMPHGLSVQELKELTRMRLAKEHGPTTSSASVATGAAGSNNGRGAPGRTSSPGGSSYDTGDYSYALTEYPPFETTPIKSGATSRSASASLVNEGVSNATAADTFGMSEYYRGGSSGELSSLSGGLYRDMPSSSSMDYSHRSHSGSTSPVSLGEISDTHSMEEVFQRYPVKSMTSLGGGSDGRASYGAYSPSHRSSDSGLYGSSGTSGPTKTGSLGIAYGASTGRDGRSVPVYGESDKDRHLQRFMSGRDVDRSGGGNIRGASDHSGTYQSSSGRVPSSYLSVHDEQEYALPTCRSSSLRSGPTLDATDSYAREYGMPHRGASGRTRDGLYASHLDEYGMSSSHHNRGDVDRGGDGVLSVSSKSVLSGSTRSAPLPLDYHLYSASSGSIGLSGDSSSRAREMADNERGLTTHSRASAIHSRGGTGYDLDSDEIISNYPYIGQSSSGDGHLSVTTAYDMSLHHHQQDPPSKGSSSRSITIPSIWTERDREEYGMPKDGTSGGGSSATAGTASNSSSGGNSLRKLAISNAQTLDTTSEDDFERSPPGGNGANAADRDFPMRDVSNSSSPTSAVTAGSGTDSTPSSPFRSLRTKKKLAIECPEPVRRRSTSDCNDLAFEVAEAVLNSPLANGSPMSSEERKSNVFVFPSIGDGPPSRRSSFGSSDGSPVRRSSFRSRTAEDVDGQVSGSQASPDPGSDVAMDLALLDGIEVSLNELDQWSGDDEDDGHDRSAGRIVVVGNVAVEHSKRAGCAPSSCGASPSGTGAKSAQLKAPSNCNVAASSGVAGTVSCGDKKPTSAGQSTTVAVVSGGNSSSKPSKGASDKKPAAQQRQSAQSQLQHRDGNSMPTRRKSSHKNSQEKSSSQQQQHPEPTISPILHASSGGFTGGDSLFPPGFETKK